MSDNEYVSFRRLLRGIFFLTFAVIAAVYIAYGYVAFKAVEVIQTNCDQGLANCAGKAVGEFQKGMNEANK